jgi:hypothetical protein
MEGEVSTHDPSSDTLTVCSDIPDLNLFFGRKEDNLKREFGSWSYAGTTQTPGMSS